MSEIIPEKHLFTSPIHVEPKKQPVKPIKKAESEDSKEPEEPKPVFDIPKVYQPAPLPDIGSPALQKIQPTKKSGWRKYLAIALILVIILALGVYIFFG